MSSSGFNFTRESILDVNTPLPTFQRSMFPLFDNAEWEKFLQEHRNWSRDALADFLSLPTSDQKYRLKTLLYNELVMNIPVLINAQGQQPPSPSRAHPIKLKVSTYSGKEKESLKRWFVEVEMGIVARRIYDESGKVSFALSCLQGSARQWGFGLLLGDPNVFPTFASFKDAITKEYEPPKSIHRSIVEFLDLSQGKRSLHNYVQEMRNVVSSIKEGGVNQGPSDQVVMTQFMKGLKPGPIRDEVFRNAPSSFEDAVSQSYMADYNFRQLKLSGGNSSYKTPRFNNSKSSNRTNSQNSSNEPEPMEIDLNAVNAKTKSSSKSNVIDKSKVVCRRCQKRGHYASECTAPSPVPAPNRSSTQNAQKNDQGKTKNGNSQ